MRSDSHWQRVSELFDAALGKPTAERDAFLDLACGGDDSVRAEVAGMLSANALAEGILERPLGEVASAALDDAERNLFDGGRAGPYELIAEAGRGGMGVVYKARDPRLNRFVAVKFLPPDLQANGQAQSRFLAEARAASALDHSNICTIYGIGETEQGKAYIAMAYYDGETLEAKISRGPLPSEEAVNIAAQVAQGLAHGHAAGIIHRDIKPSNVMVMPKGAVKILDFGVAKLQFDATKTQPGARIGTLAYMPPEQIRGETADQQSDIWSLGVVLYEMLTGRRPFAGDQEGAVLNAILHQDPFAEGFVVDGTPALTGILRKCLAKARGERYGSASELAADLRAMRPPPAPSRAPVVLTSFIGREREVKQVCKLLDTSRLVTLTGPAGTGKTRLGLQVMAELSESFSGGAYFVSLAPISDAGLVASAVANVVGIPESSTAPIAQNVKNTLCGRPVLLVIDNFEQVASSAPVLADWLAGCPELRILVTSRLALRLSGEHEYPVPSLGLPGRRAPANAAEAMSYPAVRLFADRARASLPNFHVTDENVTVVTELCRRLDGLPLAIELAAARIRLFTPQSMLKRLGGRLDLLKSSERDRPARHHTLREAIACSYELLTDQEKRFFRLLGVFVGGASLEALEAVSEATGHTGDVLDLVESLLSHSLLRRHTAADGEPRFFLLETIRVFARGALVEAGEESAARRVHAEHYLEFAEEGEPALTGPGQGAWLDQLEAEIDNFRAVWAWAEQTGNNEVALRLAAATWRFWLSRSQMEEGIRTLARILDRPGSEGLPPVRARALQGLGTLAHITGDSRHASRCFDEGLKICEQLGDSAGRANLLNGLAWLATETGELPAARKLCREALRINREVGTTRGVAIALNNLGWLANSERDFSAAQRYHEQSLAIRREISDQRGVAFALTNIAWAQAEQGRVREAEANVHEAQRVLATVEDGLLRAWTWNIEGLILTEKGDLTAADQSLNKSFRYATDIDNDPMLIWVYSFMGRLKLRAGEMKAAAAAFDASLQYWRKIGGHAGMATAICDVARLAELTGDQSKARAHYEESLAIRQEMEDKKGVTECEAALKRLA